MEKYIDFDFSNQSAIVIDMEVKYRSGIYFLSPRPIDRVTLFIQTQEGIREIDIALAGLVSQTVICDNNLDNSLLNLEIKEIQQRVFTINQNLFQYQVCINMKDKKRCGVLIKGNVKASEAKVAMVRDITNTEDI